MLHEFVCDGAGVKYMHVNDGTESELQQASYQERSRTEKNRVQGWAGPWIPVMAFAGYGTVNWTPTSMV